LIFRYAITGFVALATALSTVGVAPPMYDGRDALQGAPLYYNDTNLCGPLCLYFASRSFGETGYSLNQISELASFSGNGTTVRGLEQACAAMSLHALPVQSDLAGLKELLANSNVRAIVLLNNGHFSYVDQVRDDEIRVTSYPFPPTWYKDSQFCGAWAGTTLFVSRQPIALPTQGRLSRSLILELAGTAIAGIGLVVAIRALLRTRHRAVWQGIHNAQ